ncbi:uncharacterized protein LOC142345467 isoform X2 [Convolutriloba macropyga]|uniref:uncharacterized protein LOC142345467 isoform X2 n=1 Tax=Convolutriloba macropyga TaxID=536237 RepID=UPI003F522BB9
MHSKMRPIIVYILTFILAAIELQKSYSHAKYVNPCYDASRTLEGNARWNNPVTSGSSDQQVMVSYSWTQKEVARQIYHELIASGVNAWIDYYNMSSGNNLAQAMGEAIENATVVVICFSQSYQSSQNCRQEALYAFDLRKKLVFAKMEEDFTPTGWLGFIQAEHQYYSFYNESDFQENFDNMLANIEKDDNSSMFL